MGDVLRVSLIQTDIVWEDKRTNLNKYAAILSHITGDCDLVVFPEMFTTGFSMRAEDLAECIDGETITEVKKWSRNYNVAIAGSFIARAGNVCFNRGFLSSPMDRNTIMIRDIYSEWEKKVVILSQGRKSS